MGRTKGVRFGHDLANLEQLNASSQGSPFAEAPAEKSVRQFPKLVRLKKTKNVRHDLLGLEFTASRDIFLV
jgi:hypothetical protein